MIEVSEAVKAKIIENVQNGMPVFSDVEAKHGKAAEWCNVIPTSYSLDLSYAYRVKPKPIVINGVEYERGISETPVKNTKVFVCDSGVRDGMSEDTWVGNNTDFEMLEAGYVFLTSEPAARLGKAIRALTVKP